MVQLKTLKFAFEIYWPLVRYEVRQNAFKLFLATLWLNYKYFLQHLLCSFPPKNASHSFVRLYKTSKVSITHILLFEFSKRSQLYLGNLSFQYTANPFPVMTTWISLCTKSHREISVMNTVSLQWEQGFPVMKTGFSLWEFTTQGKPCSGPVLTL